MNDRRTHLKVRIKELASEAGHIRLEERKAKAAGDTRSLNSLTEHRKHVVRPAARLYLLAYACVRGRGYSTQEPTAKTAPNWRAVARIARKFGPSQAPGETDAAFKDRVDAWAYRVDSWISEAKAYREGVSARGGLAA